MVEVGSKCPDFAAESTEGPLTLQGLCELGPFVLYFYPKDATPGCTAEACDFRDMLRSQANPPFRVVGVSKDLLPVHRKFIRQNNLNFPLITDHDGSICEAFGVWVEKRMMGRRYVGIERSTFVIGADATVLAVWRKVRVAEHVVEIQAFMDALGASR